MGGVYGWRHPDRSESTYRRYPPMVGFALAAVAIPVVMSVDDWRLRIAPWRWNGGTGSPYRVRTHRSRLGRDRSLPPPGSIQGGNPQHNGTIGRGRLGVLAS